MPKPKILLFILLLGFIFLNCHRAYADQVDVGTTFSQVQCEYLDIDWKDTYRKTLAMEFDILRLGSYWSRIEREKGVFDFSELDWQLERALESNQKILLVVGMKAPRWPEYYIPDWLEQEVTTRKGANIAADPLIKEYVLDFINRVVERYKQRNIIVAWQVENEPFNHSGPMEWWISDDFLKEEVELVRSLDPYKRPIVTNALTTPNKMLGFFSRLKHNKSPVIRTIDFAQIPALNVYAVIGHKIWFFEMCFKTDPMERIEYLKDLVSYAAEENKTLWVTELQAEPWEPGHLVFKGEQSKTCSPTDFINTFDEIKSLGIDTIFLWGTEYWFFRINQYQDYEWKNAVLEMLDN